MDYTPNKNYNQRIEHYQNIFSLAEDVGNISKDDVEIDIKNNEEDVEVSLDFSKVEKNISNINKDLISNVESLFQMVRDEIEIDLDSASKIYINEVNNNKEEGCFPYEEWETCATFKKEYFKNIWKLNLDIFEKIVDFELDSPAKIALYLENLADYLYMKKHILNIREHSELRKELYSVKNLLKRQSKILGDNKYFNHFYEQILFKVSPYQYIYNIVEDMPKEILANEWSDYATMVLTEQWNKEEGAYLWDKFHQHLTNLDNPEKEKFIVNFLNYFFLPKQNLPQSCFKNEKIDWEGMYVLMNQLEQYHEGIYNKILDHLKTKIYDEKLKEELEKCRLDFRLKKELTVNESNQYRSKI